MAAGIDSSALALHRQMYIKAAGVEPDASTTAQWFRFCDLRQFQETAVERAGLVLTPFRHRNVDVRKTHGVRERP